MKVLVFFALFIISLNGQSYEIGSHLSLDHQDLEIQICANDSGPITLSVYNGDLNGGEYHVIWLNFFATWCISCQDEIPLLFNLNNQFADRGLTVLSLGRQWDYPYNCQGWSELGLSTPVLDDDTTSIWSWFGLGYVPQQVILDHTMTVRYNDFGFDASEIAYTIDLLLDEMASVNISEENLPGKFEITPPYPNPFNFQVTWNLNLHRETFVETTVIDLSGKVVSTIIAESLPAGSHSFNWSAEDLPSGIYFLDVATPFYRKTHKMILLK